jgi:ADP-ribosylation factor related protein 1
MPSSQLTFLDLGGQTGIRSIWHRYYTTAHALIYVLDASAPARSRLPEAWDTLNGVLGADEVVMRNVPLLLLANKQDTEECMGVGEVRWEWEAWSTNHQRRRNEGDEQITQSRNASLDVMGVSALQGYCFSLTKGTYIKS